MSVRSLLVAAALATSYAAAADTDPCAKVAGRAFVPPAEARACQQSFPFNQTLRANILANVNGVMDFFTFEEYYKPSPIPYQESTIDVRKELKRIGSAKYDNDWAFNKDLVDTIQRLNDGHTRWLPNCYRTYQNYLPAPIVTLSVNGIQNVYIAPDSVEFLSSLPAEFAAYFESIKFDWKRLAGALVLEIEGQSAYGFVDHIASTIPGNYLDHGIRVNSVFSSYRVAGTTWSQALGALAGPLNVNDDSLTFKIIPAGSLKSETIKIPYLANFVSNAFTDKASFWKNNCAVTAATNGEDYSLASVQAKRTRRQPIAALPVEAAAITIGLPTKYLPTVPLVGTSTSVIKSYILPDGKTGVLYIGSFSPADFYSFQTDVVNAITAFKAAGVTRLLLDVTNNGGGYVCLGQFLHRYLAGSKIGNPGFVSTMRAPPLAKKIVKATIALGHDSFITGYSGDNWAFLNGTIMPKDYNFLEPDTKILVNGKLDATSQLFYDTCELSFTEEVPDEPPFDLKNVAIVSNGNCASTCAMFTVLMNERHNTKIAVFGGNPFQPVEFKGMAGNQVLDWAAFASEIKTAKLQNDPLSPPDLLIAGNFRHNWRSAWSYVVKVLPIAYVPEYPKYRFAYTKETYNNPQNLWTFAASKLF